MKSLKCAVMLLFISVAAYSQTMDLGHGAFSSEDGKIMMVIDASLANLKMNRPYVMFMAWMMAKSPKGIEIGRDDVVMLYKGQEYKMAPFREVRENYPLIDLDAGLYSNLMNTALRFSILKYYVFPSGYDFFPSLGLIRADEGYLDDQVGFKTKFYFKNPGFQKGDELVFQVKDKNNPDVTGQILVVLQ